MNDQGDLFGAAASHLPPGLRYEEEFLAREEEARLLAILVRLPFANMKYQQFTALRRVVSYGGQYDFSAQRLDAAEPLPDWPVQPKKADVLRLTLAPRSIYLLRGAARWEWQHSVAATRQLRYSITLRTARGR